jgi:hypothetical protein
MKQSATLALLLLALGPVAAQTLTTTSGTTLTVTNGAVLYVAGSVQNAASSTLTNAGTVRLTGDLVNAGTLASTGELLFNGAQDQTFTPGTAATISNLTLNNTGAAANRLFLAGDLTVGSLLTLTKGLVRTQGLGANAPLYTLRLASGGQVQGEAAGQYVLGRLQVARDAVNANTAAVDFTNGLVLNPNGQDLGAVTVTRTAGLQQAGVSYGQNVGGTSQGIDRVWQVVASKPPSPTAPTSVTLSWVSDDDHGFNPAAPAQLWRADQATGPWVPQGAPTSASARSFTANTTQLGTLTVSNTSQPLPVTLVAFTAQAQGPDGLLRWTTASELRNDYFVVESGVDGVAFQALGKVAGHGTSAQAHDYQQLDRSLARYGVSTVYYRLRQVDLDGTATYSPVRTLAVGQTTGWLAQVYPNPSAATAALTLLLRTGQAGPATLTLTDVLGRQLGQQQLSLPQGESSWPLAGSAQLATGVYLLRVQQGPQTQVFKLVRQ